MVPGCPGDGGTDAGRGCLMIIGEHFTKMGRKEKLEERFKSHFFRSKYEGERCFLENWGNLVVNLERLHSVYYDLAFFKSTLDNLQINKLVSEKNELADKLQKGFVKPSVKENFRSDVKDMDFDLNDFHYLSQYY